jgi:hypothetical protein
MSEVKIIDKYIECVSNCISEMNQLELTNDVEKTCHKKCNENKEMKEKKENNKMLNEKFPEDLYK